MAVIHKQVGSGLTATDVIRFQGELTPEEQAKLEELAELQNIDRRLEHIIRACAEVLAASALPVCSGHYIVGRDGQWRVSDRLRAGETYSSSVWIVARQAGFALDSKEGFAARMLDDVTKLKDERASGDHDEALMTAFFLGVKWSAAGIKTRHGSRSRPAEPVRMSARDMSMATEFKRRRAANTTRSDSALKADIGKEQVPPLKRSAAIDAVNRGLQLLSG